MPSKRLQILNAIETALEAISTGGGYNNDISTDQVSQVFQSPYDNPGADFPYLFVIPGASNYSPLTNSEYTSGTAFDSEDGFLVGVVGYVRVAKDTSKSGLLTTALENLIEDIIKAIQVDHHLGLSAFVQNSYLRRVEPYLDYENSIGRCEIVYAVKYDFSKTAP